MRGGRRGMRSYRLAGRNSYRPYRFHRNWYWGNYGLPLYYNQHVPEKDEDKEDDEEPHWSTQPFVLLSILLGLVLAVFMLRDQ